MSDRLNKDEPTRRDLLGIAGTVAASCALLASAGGMALLPMPRLLPEPSARFRLGRPDEFPPGTERIFPERNVLVVASEAGLAAISLECTHLGCIVSKDDGGFSCPCHGSRFALDGSVQRGPAPKALPWFEISRAANGSLVADAATEVDTDTWFTAETAGKQA